MEAKYVNECNEEIPDYIFSKAKELGCIDHSYIYKEGEYGGKLPKASIGCSKATPFRNATNAESMKIPLGDGWVAFKSPSGTGSKSSSESKAEKHTSILCQIEDIFERLYHNKYKTYLTTHTSEYYKEAEKESKRTFYHLKMYTTDQPESGSNVKDPDIIIVERDEIQYVIEVKWGYLEDYPSEPTDLKSIFEQKELNEIISMIRKSKVCRVKGPYIQNGTEVNENENLVDFKVHSNTKFLVVSDFGGLRESNPADFNLIKNQYKNYDNLFCICDIKKDVDTVYSLEAFLKENKNKNTIISSNSAKKSEYAFKDRDNEKAANLAEDLNNHENKKNRNCLLEPIVYGVKQKYSSNLQIFSCLEIFWLICFGLVIGLLAARDVITGKESIGFMIFVWVFLMGIICGPVYLIQFLWVKKVRKKQQIERQKTIGDYRGNKKRGACCPVCEKKSITWIRYKLNKQYVCKDCWKKGQEEYLRAVIEKWQECPICGSKEGFEIKVGLVSKLACKSCSAEWTLHRTLIGGEIKGIYLSKADTEKRAVRYLLKKHPLKWWEERKWAEEGISKEEAVTITSAFGYKGATNEIIKSLIEEFVKNKDYINTYPLYSQGSIPKRKLENALSYISKGVNEEEILFFVDFTVWGSGKEGLVFTSDKLFWRSTLGEKNEGMIEYAKIKSVSSEGKKLVINSTKIDLGVQTKKNRQLIQELLMQIKENIEKMKMGKYEKLGKYLDGLKEKEITLTFEEIEYILGFQLPSSARQYPAWWAKDKTHSHAVNGWLNYGWRTRNPNFSEEVVQFFRVNEKAIEYAEKCKETSEFISSIESEITEIKSSGVKIPKSDELIEQAKGEEIKEKEDEMPVEKKERALIIERAIYDPCKGDFVERTLPRMKDWIDRHDPSAYWFAVSIQNNTDRVIDEWGAELETSSALKVEKAIIEGMEYKIELRETYPEPYKNKYAIGVPKEYGIVIPKGGAQRVYFKLHTDKPKTTYKISGVFKSAISGDVPIRTKEFKYLCDTGVSPEAVKAELKKTFSEKDAARLALSFKTVQELDRMCNQDAKTEEYLDKLLVLRNYTEGFSDTFTNQVDELSRFMKEEQIGYLDDEYKGRVRRFCTNLVDVWISEFLKG